MAIDEIELYEHRLGQRLGPVLSDGTHFSELFDLEKREVSMRVLTDPELHRIELKRIFARSWVAIGHVSEIPTVGDYVQRYIGLDKVIVTRTRDGEVAILLNACAHRGMEICWADEGNASSFKCPYHGWVFDTAGNLLGAPFEKEMYGDWDKSQYGLRTAAVAVRHGVIFGNFSTDPPSLDDWFGEFGWYFDVMYGGAEMEASGGMSGFSGVHVPANWKAAAEQNSGDGYHTVTLHHAMVELGLITADAKDAKGLSLDCHDVSCWEGHGIRCVELPTGGDTPFYQSDVEQNFPVGWFLAGSMFPGVGVGGQVMPNPLDPTSLVRTANIGSFVPTSPTSYLSWGITLVQKDAPEVLKAMSRRQSAVFGAIGADDLESWPSMTRVALGAVAQEETIKYNAILGHNNPKDFPGPALVHQGFSKDDNQWHFWLRYFEMMTEEVPTR